MFLAARAALLSMRASEDFGCAAENCDRPPRNESEVPSGCLELERKMGVGGVRCRF